jgi:hypothetical protein
MNNQQPIVNPRSIWLGIAIAAALWICLGIAAAVLSGCGHPWLLTAAHKDAAQQWARAYDKDTCHDGQGNLKPDGEACQARNGEWMQLFQVNLEQTPQQ